MGKSVWAWAVGFPLVVGGVAFASWRFTEVTEREWRAMVATAEVLEASLDACEDRRVVLYGEPVGGRASDEYARAVALMSPRAVERIDQHLEARASSAGSEFALPAELLADNALALAAVARGAHCDEVGFDIDWNRGFSLLIPSLRDYRGLAHLLRFSALEHLEQGRSERAAEVLLDGMQLGRDLFHAPVLLTSMIGGMILTQASHQPLVEDGLLDRLEPEALRILSAGMRRLDASLRLTSRSYEAEVVLFTRGIDHGDLLGSYFGGQGLGIPFGSRFRYGFSLARMCAAHVRESEQWLKLLRATDGASWPERERALAAATDLCMRSENPVTAIMTPKVLSAERAVYDAITRFRLARAEVELRLNGDVSAIVDPYGGTIVVRLREGAPYAHSGGADDPDSSLYRVDRALPSEAR